MKKNKPKIWRNISFTDENEPWKFLVMEMLRITLYNIDKPYLILGINGDSEIKEEIKEYKKWLESLKSWTDKSDNIWFIAWEEFTGYEREVIRNKFNKKINKKLDELEERL